MTKDEFLTELNELKTDFEYMIRRMQMSLSNVNWILDHFLKQEIAVVGDGQTLGGEKDEGGGE